MEQFKSQLYAAISYLSVHTYMAIQAITDVCATSRESLQIWTEPAVILIKIIIVYSNESEEIQGTLSKLCSNGNASAKLIYYAYMGPIILLPLLQSHEFSW